MNPYVKAILAFAADDPTRALWQNYAQTHDVDGQRWLWATDGHRLHACRTELPGGAYGRDGWEPEAACRAPKGAASAHWPEQYGGVKTSKHEATISHIADKVRALQAYTDKNTSVSVSLGGEYRMYRHFTQAQRKRLTKAKLIATAEGITPGGHLLDSAMPDGPEIPALNVDYLVDAVTWTGSTIVHYTDALSPVLFAGKDAWAIVMPVRR